MSVVNPLRLTASRNDAELRNWRPRLDWPGRTWNPRQRLNTSRVSNSGSWHLSAALLREDSVESICSSYHSDYETNASHFHLRDVLSTLQSSLGRRHCRGRRRIP